MTLLALSNNILRTIIRSIPSEIQVHFLFSAVNKETRDLYEPEEGHTVWYEFKTFFKKKQCKAAEKKKAIVRFRKQCKNAHNSLQQELKPVVKQAQQRCNNLPEDITSDKLTSQDLLGVWSQLKCEKWLWEYEDISVLNPILQRMSDVVARGLEMKEEINESVCPACSEKKNLKLAVCQCRELRKDGFPHFSHCSVLCDTCISDCKTLAYRQPHLCPYCFEPRRKCDKLLLLTGGGIWV